MPGGSHREALSCQTPAYTARPMRNLARLLLIAMIALLPLRGLTATLMAFDVAAPAASQHTDEHVAAVSPCHESHADGQSGAEDSSSTHHGCSLCVLCHSAAVPPLDQPTLASGDAPSAPASCARTGSAQREPGPLDRPPTA